MDTKRVDAALETTNEAVKSYLSYLDSYTLFLRVDLRASGQGLKEETSLRIGACEAELIRHVSLIADSAAYHLDRAYFQASPGLIAVIMGIIALIGEIISWIQIINDVILALTGEGLAHWLDYLIPGFEAAWTHLLDEISKISAKLGWGVDGISHLLNAANIGADTWCQIRGQSRDSFRVEKINRTQQFLNNIGYKLDEWEKRPGSLIDWFADYANRGASWEGSKFFKDLGYKFTAIAHTTEGILTNISGIAGELGALQDGMPDFIAQHIPPGIWDGLERTQDVIDQAILPAITDITDRIAEVNAVLDAYRERAEALAESLNRPGDLLDRISQLEESAQLDQYEKVDAASSAMLEKVNTEEFTAFEMEFSSLDSIVDALTQAPPQLPFMTLELPGASPGIVAEPRETWFVGDY